MSKFRVGQKVRCVDVPYWGSSLVLHQEYTIAAVVEDGACVLLNELSGQWFASRFEPVAGGAAQPDALRAAYEFYRRNVGAQAERADPWRNFVPAGMEPPGAAERARAMLPDVPVNPIFHVKPYRPLPDGEPPKPADPRSEGIGRAVDRLSHFEPRLGAARYSPEDH